MDNRAIGVFDSGIGGLTSVEFIMKMFPEERILFFGDTGRTPYGSKAARTIRSFTAQIGKFMWENDVKMMVAACNTISSVSLDVLKSAYPGMPILGTIDPTSQVVARQCVPEDRIGILATKATVDSGVYPRAIREKNPELLHIYQKACPLFVPMIEEGLIENPIMDLTIRYYLDAFIRDHRIDTLVLACTHYPLIAKNLKRLYPGVRLINSSKETASAVGEVLNARGIAAGEGDKPDHLFYASDLSDNFIRMISDLLEGRAEEDHIRFKSLEMQEEL